ncbi:hypothetical protein AB2M62_03665 [Sphingomonas sp. MMS12-HWE2-04]|uniref:hypothetical protein n=1 Tax=Sphingomonas sp. MMS12-HWE2-04 TaxID=3234199 RepID=UPI0038515534
MFGGGAKLPAMYVLNQDLARRRLFYPRPILTLPDVMVIDIPARFAAPSLPLGRFYPIMVETEREQLELAQFLAEDRPGPVSPDLLDYRATQLSAQNITIATYDPPETGWPWLLLCHWPAAYSAMVGDRSTFARGAYTTEMFETLDALNAASAQLLSVLGAANDLDVQLLPHQGVAVGRA